MNKQGNFFQTILEEFTEQKLINMYIHGFIFNDENLYSINSNCFVHFYFLIYEEVYLSYDP